MPVLTSRQLRETVSAYQDLEEWAFDVETRGPHRGDPRRGEVFWLTLAGPGRADVIPMGHPLGRVTGYQYSKLKKDGQPYKNAKRLPVHGRPPDQLRVEEVFEALRPLFLSPARKIGHNVKFDAQAVAKYLGQLPAPPFGDTMIAAYLLNENHLGNRPYSLGSCVLREFDASYDKSLGKIGVDTFAFPRAAAYSHCDAKYCWLLWRRYGPRIDNAGLGRVHALETELIEVVCAMEMAGAPIDEAALATFAAELEERLAETAEKIHLAAGAEINLNAARQVADLFFRVRGHKPKALTPKTKEPALGADDLAHLAERDPVVAAYLEWKELHKLYATYVVNIRAMLHEGRLYADFDQRGAATGRFACRTPNLQNIPTKHGKRLRELFIAPPGHKMIVADLSQIELRVLAEYCRDPVMLRAYATDADLHTQTAAKIFHVRPEDVSELQRAIGKTLNFAVIYGGGPDRIAAVAGVSKTEAREFLRMHRRMFPRIYDWQSKCLRECRRRGISRAEAKRTCRRPSVPYATTMLGRKRRLPELFSDDEEARGHAMRQAINHPIQGSAADILKIAMVNLHRKMKNTMAQMVMTVHDELVVLAPSKAVERVEEMVRDSMEHVDLPLKVRLKVDIKVVDRWSEK